MFVILVFYVYGFFVDLDFLLMILDIFRVMHET